MCCWDTCLERCWESRRSTEVIGKLLLIASVTERQQQLSGVFKPTFYIVTSVQASVFVSTLSCVVLQFGQIWLNLNGFVWECGITSSTCPICIPRANFFSTCLKPGVSYSSKGQGCVLTPYPLLIALNVYHKMWLLESSCLISKATLNNV